MKTDQRSMQHKTSTTEYPQETFRGEVYQKENMCPLVSYTFSYSQENEGLRCIIPNAWGSLPLVQNTSMHCCQHKPPYALPSYWNPQFIHCCQTLPLTSSHMCKALPCHTPTNIHITPYDTTSPPPLATQQRCHGSLCCSVNSQAYPLIEPRQVYLPQQYQPSTCMGIKNKNSATIPHQNPSKTEKGYGSHTIF